MNTHRHPIYARRFKRKGKEMAVYLVVDARAEVSSLPPGEALARAAFIAPAGRPAPHRCPCARRDGGAPPGQARRWAASGAALGRRRRRAEAVRGQLRAGRLLCEEEAKGVPEAEGGARERGKEVLAGAAVPWETGRGSAAQRHGVVAAGVPLRGSVGME